MFSGGCTLDAIEEVCSGDAVERSAALDLVASLVSRSLVIVEDDRTGTRYRLLETIREYSEERLAEYGEIDALVAGACAVLRTPVRSSGRKFIWPCATRVGQASQPRTRQP